jgi:outer membrane immunogenic protein
MKFKTKLLVAAGAMVLAGAASAQAYNWNGYYAGFTLGGQKGKADVATTFDDANDYFNQASPGDIAAASAASPSRTRFQTGVTFGYNSVSGNQLMGYELDLSFLELRLKHTAVAEYSCCGGFFAVDQRVKAHHLVTARGRWGMLSGNSLFYVTGGLAASRLSSYATFSDDIVNASTGTKKIKLGWALGAGYEQPMSNGWTFKTEYLHVNFNNVGSSSRNLSVGDVLFNDTMHNKADVKLDILRVGFNKKF